MPERGKPGTLFMIPSPIAEGVPGNVLPRNFGDRIRHIRHFLAEKPRTSRRFLSAMKIYPSIEELSFSVLDKETKERDMPERMKPLRDGHDMGVLSEAGCPGIADPGALAAAYAHSIGALVVPLVGPSSILLALMASGLNGQKFAFHGYLPVKKDELEKTIRELEKESRAKSQTQLFIETPYRNRTLLDTMLKITSPSTRLCVAEDLSGQEEKISTHTVAEWKGENPGIGKLPTMFLMLA